MFFYRFTDPLPFSTLCTNCISMIVRPDPPYSSKKPFLPLGDSRDFATDENRPFCDSVRLRVGFHSTSQCLYLCQRRVFRETGRNFVEVRRRCYTPCDGTRRMKVHRHCIALRASKCLENTPRMVTMPMRQDNCFYRRSVQSQGIEVAGDAAWLGTSVEEYLVLLPIVFCRLGNGWIESDPEINSRSRLKVHEP